MVPCSGLNWAGLVVELAAVGAVHCSLLKRPRHRRILATGELKPWQVGVVTPYMGQVRRLRRAISQNLRLENPRELLVASVDSFQGREKELILFSAVRSNPSRRVGFLADWRRLNVMITRARRGLVIIGDARTLKRDPGWSAYIKWAKNAGYMRQV
eukprot:Skav233363  [mRNA]  locus=scaffold394:594125:594734:+ [translate_table: standard]